MNARCCSIAPRPRPISPTAAPATAISKPTAWRCSAARYADRKEWRPALDAMRLALDLRETAELRGQYERLRVEHGFRMLDYSVDSDAISPRACFQFSEELPGRRTDFSPFVAVAGQDKPAISANDKQLCVEGLKHGERYQITLRAGLPSTVQGDAGEIGRLHHLRARPQAVRALFRQGLRAAAHRPARHSGAQRQHRRGAARSLPHRRPQPDRDRAGLRLPAQSDPIRGRAARPTSVAPRSGAANSPSSPSSIPRLPRHFRSIRRSANSNPAST